jgi:uncharacterized protein (DUF1330 family)
MPAFCLFQNLKITHPQKMDEYVRKVKPITESFGGRYVVLGGEVQVKEGAWSPVWPVVIEFPTMQAANDWYNSPAYAPLKALRLAAGEFSAVFIDGVSSQPNAVKS